MAALVAGLMTTPAVPSTDLVLTPAPVTAAASITTPMLLPSVNTLVTVDAPRPKAPTRAYLYGAFTALQIGDIVTTTVNLNRGAIEANGLLQNVSGSPVKLTLVKAALSGVVLGPAETMWKSGERKGAIATMLITTAASAFVVAHNLRVHAQLTSVR